MTIFNYRLYLYQEVRNMGRKKKPVDKEIGIRLKNLRRDYLNLSQIELAQKYGYVESTIRAWESGTRNIPLEFLQQLSDDYDISLSVLLGIETAGTVTGNNLLNHWDTVSDENKVIIDYLESIRVGVDFTPSNESSRSFKDVIFTYELYDLDDDSVIRILSQNEWELFKSNLAEITKKIIKL